MARIRTIKPEFWDSPSTGKAGPWARLAFIAMWNWADDYGRGTLNYKELEGFIFPHDDTFTDRSGNTVHFRAVVAEVSECFGVALYEHEGRQFYAIPSWDLHQRNERRAKASKHPGPDEGIPLTTGDAEQRDTSAAQERKYRTLPRNSSLGTGEQGNRGTGEQISIVHSDDPLTPLADPHPATKPKPRAEHFDQWWTAYPKKVGKAKAQTKYRQVVASGVPEDQLLSACLNYARATTTTEPCFIANPTTWLNQGRWDDDMSAYRRTDPDDRNAGIIDRAFANYYDQPDQREIEE